MKDIILDNKIIIINHIRNYLSYPISINIIFIQYITANQINLFKIVDFFLH